jgi:hypothetical protein
MMSTKMKMYPLVVQKSKSFEHYYDQEITHQL